MHTYKVVAPLRHNGRRYEEGDSVEMTERQARSLLSLGEPPIQNRSPSPPTPAPEPEIAEEIPTPATESQIDLNDPELTVEAIATLSYISEERAELILEKRQELGEFTELDQVPYLREEHYDRVKL